MGLNDWTESWTRAECDVCGLKSSDWKTRTWEPDEGQEPDYEANMRRAEEEGFRLIGLFSGLKVTVCGACRAAILARQVEQGFGEGMA